MLPPNNKNLSQQSSNFEQSRVVKDMPFPYLVPERKLGFFVQIKEDEDFNHRNTLEYFED